MSASTDADLDARLRRLERIAVVTFVQFYGSAAHMDFARLRAQAKADAQAIVTEHAAPPIERRDE